MNKITPVAPYDDDKMVWNSATEQYELKLSYCLEEFDINFLNDDGEHSVLQKRIKKNSKLVYRFINNRVNQYNRLIVLKLLNRTEEGRKFIFNLLNTQFESDTDIGYNDLTNSTAVNLSNGHVIDREEISRNAVTVATEQEWDNSSQYFGINLGFQGIFPQYYFMLMRNI